MKRIAGDVGSPAQLKERLEKLKSEFDKRLHELETEAEERLHRLESNTDKRVHTIETWQLVVQTLLGAILVGLLMTIGGAVVKYLYERSTDKPVSTSPTRAQAAAPPATPTSAPAIQKVVD